MGEVRIYLIFDIKILITQNFTGKMSYNVLHRWINRVKLRGKYFILIILYTVKSLILGFFIQGKYKHFPQIITPK